MGGGRKGRERERKARKIGGREGEREGGERTHRENDAQLSQTET